MEGSAGSLPARGCGGKERVFGVEQRASPGCGSVLPSSTVAASPDWAMVCSIQLVCCEASAEILSMFSLVRSDAPASGVSCVCPDVSCLISQFGVYPSRGSRGLMVAQPLLRAPRSRGGGGSKASWLLIQVTASVQDPLRSVF